ncbi:unnamed protein product [Moneuplotes crassus]|uniref:Pre-mRNA polyadenylation factor Fip1 domain-containing protein n=1 Tax=Euplotes crassus TaxID=5936 RepID=A0AAD2D7F8_EUPCR|nr:unnamed protein product [Moneuplotes crassus]
MADHGIEEEYEILDHEDNQDGIPDTTADQGEIDSDLEDYDIDAEETQDVEFGFQCEFYQTLSAYCAERDKANQFPNDSDVKNKPWLREGVDRAEFFNFGLCEDQWKLLVNKHILMMYEKHSTLKLIRHFLAQSQGRNMN